MPWSFQPEAKYISAEFNGDAYAELDFYYSFLKVAALFHEAPDMARQSLACDSK